MNNIQLMFGDCLELMKDIPDKSVDMILADLPYGTTSCKWDIVIPFEPLWEQYKRILLNSGNILLFSSQPFTSLLICSNLKMFKYCWTWKKNYPTGIAFSKYQPMRVIEEICVFYWNKSIYNPQLRDCAPSVVKRWKDGQIEGLESQISGSKSHSCSGKRHIIRYKVNPVNFLEFPSVVRSKGTLHPTQKPVPLLEYLIKTYTLEGQTVLDNVMGSGSTGVAAKHLNRNFIGIEKDAHYFEVAKNRIETE